MKFSLYDDINQPILQVDADSEKEAWQTIRKAGIRNRGNIFNLIEEEG
jgi:hypothetical protein